MATKAMVTPKELIITYFQAASSDLALASRPTSTTLASVLASTSIQSRPRLPVRNTASMAEANTEKKAK